MSGEGGLNSTDKTIADKTLNRQPLNEFGIEQEKEMNWNSKYFILNRISSDFFQIFKF
jgi:hypothetical protein